MTHQKILTWIHPIGQRWLAQPPVHATSPASCGVFQVTQPERMDDTDKGPLRSLLMTVDLNSPQGPKLAERVHNPSCSSQRADLGWGPHYCPYLHGLG